MFVYFILILHYEIDSIMKTSMEILTQSELTQSHYYEVII